MIEISRERRVRAPPEKVWALVDDLVARHMERSLERLAAAAEKG